MAVFTTLATFFALQWATTVIGPTKVMSYTYLNPALVLLIGLALGQGAPSAFTLPGIAIVAVATLILQRAGPSSGGAAQAARAREDQL